MVKGVRYSEEVKERAIRLVYESVKDHGSQWTATKSIAAKIGCTLESLRSWIQQLETDSGKQDGPTSDERARIKELEKENRELKRANEILIKVSTYFVQRKLDHPLKASRPNQLWVAGFTYVATWKGFGYAALSFY